MKTKIADFGAAAYAKDVRLLHPTKAVEAYVCSIVGRRSYALARVKTDSI